ncbi:MAG: zinc-ribbon domain-containing protein [Kordiimonadaceae bacterium]|nr:zinc-ribbon domain-containing protein [Kordiimonadaceae bacterium]MBO6567863.1 zinc-ribbon domain-containing protein [Kordiimonadaceae bacterium]MBO6964407.1 zinc-ribbon domain-containing protein [Kordiimonadaceae bacterium]
MILVCPSCDAKFKVPDNAIPPEGRKVRCANCGNAWHATKADELKAPPRAATAAAPKPAPRAAAPVTAAPKPATGPENFTPPVVDMDAGAAAQAAALRRSVAEEESATAPAPPEDNLFSEGPEPASDDDFDDDLDGGEGYSVSEDDDLATADDVDANTDEDFDDDEDFGDFDEDDILARRRGDLRREAERKIQSLKRKLLAAGWIALLAFIVFVLFSLFFMKEMVTSAYPGTNQLYDFFAEAREDSIYQPDTAEPLTRPITETEVYVRAGLFQDQMRIETIDGVNHVMIVGRLENTGTRAASVPKVEISIKDTRGRVLDQWVFDPPGLVLRRASTLRFETTRPAPAGMASVEVKPLEGTQSENRAPQI